MGFYATLRDEREHSEDLQACIREVVERLETATDPKSPGMLLGRIQSGKTRAFLGVIALAFDRGYDIAIVLTKGTKTLASQTVKRIGRDFRTFIEDDEMVLFDIMSAPDPLTRAEQRRKIVIVAKKQVNNLDRIQELFETKYPDWKEKSVLLVDDEADMASVRFSRKSGETDIDQGAIANRMDRLRGSVTRMSFLQVTATPYALYLQPENFEGATNAREVFYPKRPVFTVLLPTHPAYVGGDDYFGGHGPDDPRYYLHVEVDADEQDALRAADGRVIREDRLWTSANVRMLRRSLMTFLLAVAIRRHQQESQHQRKQKYAMVIHNDTQRLAHKWQRDTVENLLKMFEQAAGSGDARLRDLFEVAYADLSQSIKADGGHVPPADNAFEDVKTLILDGELNVQRVNTDVPQEPLLDADTAELRLRTKANLYIGGSILDRGITVPNLIAFYYGRNPRRMQADTVLQHSRMYGARPKADLAVTRFYTSAAVYARLQQINALENALREAFENGAHKDGVVFIQSDPSGGVVPCAPSKISLSDVVAVRPGSVLTPNGFDTIAQTQLTKHIRKLDALVPQDAIGIGEFVDISLNDAIAIVDAIEPTLAWTDRQDFDWDAMRGLMRYWAEKADGQVKFLAEVGRRLNRAKSNDRSGLSILGSEEFRNIVRDTSRDGPALVLLKQDGGTDLEWKAGPFWWPMLASPTRVNPCVFASKVAA
ncbi:Z1 domain-containing protein [Mesorhizobium sp. VK23B]|uniref:Z1 domain-containing protein n=1 Tax=Mesorhizobium dulcispinae TaxID=3072316 RepID=A0ABU4XCF5_9HYPH|nr:MULTISPECIES: Z1 domain-containing protein [unclassified Mesorhizobium]MDX8465743.1 Z1 domain-containing protein [Mesorhizobium sp. VK23B]MDX8471455.1 Z1 domain-containing protein [Mesorhizobium sp. VK23A]